MYAIRTVAAVLTLSFAIVVLIPDLVFAAPAPKGHSMRAMRAMMTEMKAKDPQGYAACEALARQRGYSAGDLSGATMMFIDGCMSGKQR